MVTAKVRSVLRSSKDAALAYGARTIINNRLRAIGEATELSVDTKKRAIRVHLHLTGEAKPIEIYVRKYALQRVGEHPTLTVVAATASREWVAAALREFVVGRTFRIPPNASVALKLLG
jgi:hypothetical protein